MEYWIDGHFDVFWNQTLTWYSVDRGVFIPKFATIRREPDRIYITEQFAKKILAKTEFDSTSEYDMFDMSLKNKINVPWKKEPYVEPEPRFKVSLP